MTAATHRDGNIPAVRRSVLPHIALAAALGPRAVRGSALLHIALDAALGLLELIKSLASLALHCTSRRETKRLATDCTLTAKAQRA